MVFLQEQRIFLLKRYYETKSYKIVRNQLQVAYPDENVMPDSSTQCLVKKFEETGTVRDLPGPGRRTKQTEEMKDVVKTRLEARLMVVSSSMYGKNKDIPIISKFFLLILG